MITNNELNAVTLSATKKDYYQIWNELLEIAGKISNRWNPAHANESDPGVVLLKVLTAIADKLNYNIDINTLEAFMPTAAQEESMRNLCEMMGYNMKYYQSAVTEIVMNFVGDKAIFTDNGISDLTLPMFSSITNAEKDINYVTLEAKNFSTDLNSQNILCIEGQHVLCETINNNIVTIELLDDNNRFYLPETQIAENGIFVYSIKDGVKSTKWEKRTNLYTERLNNQIYKFGYDSREARPYLQFPEDISQIIGDGLEIHYIRTSGNAGNIAALTLNTFELPSDDNWKKFTTQDFTIYNLSAAQSGSNKESITAAYENYKKTIGTFDTLVTCRDYMNKIYSLMEDDNTPMVSNIMVSDIRSDINRAIVLCSFNDFGVCYKEQPIITENNGNKEALIDHFDLILYPFKTVYGNNNQSEYISSFKLYKDNGLSIEKELENNKTIAHKIKYPEDHEIVAIKNYLRLDAKITTTEKVNLAEETIILDAIKKEIYTKFNMRKMEFGEEIPFESILDAIEYAHPKIKNVVLNEPILYTKFLLGDGTEHDLSSTILIEESNTNTSNIKFLGKELYNKLALRNILAGRIELFNYNTDFSYTLNESKYIVQTGNASTDTESYPAVLPDPNQSTVNNSIKNITRIEPKFSLQMNESGQFIRAGNTSSSNYQLTKNQEIKFRCPNFITDITYPAYVNYYLKLSSNNVIQSNAVAAKFHTIGAFMTKPVNNLDYWDIFYNYLQSKSSLYLTKAAEDAGENPFKQVPKNYIEIPSNNSSSKSAAVGNRKTHNQLKSLYGAIWTRSVISGTTTYKYTRVTLNNDESYIEGDAANKTYYYLPIDDKTFIIWKAWLRSLNASTVYNLSDNTNNFVLDIYRSLGANATRQVGYLVDASLKKYQSCNVYHSFTNYLTDYYVPEALGIDAVLGSIKKNTEYQLKRDEYLFINYTPSKTTTAEDGTQTNEEGDPKHIIYGPGSIIKPNFDLSDSAALKQNSTKRWAKTDNINFELAERHGVFTDAVDTNIEGMFGLSSNEKIEHRNMVYVSINKPYFMYWVFKNGITGIDGTSRVNSEIKEHGKYTLQEGEYLFITGASEGSPKVDMSYYGNGTEINVIDNTSDSTQYPENFFNTNLDNSIALDDILINGVAGIPWQYYSFSTSQYLLIREYQYLTLGESDIITTLDIDSTEVNKDWQKVNAANYIMNGESKTLPIININEGLLFAAIAQEAGLTIEDQYLNSTDLVSWEIKSVFHLKTDKNNCLELLENEELVIKDETATNVIEQTIKAKTDAQGKVIPVQIQSNIAIDSSQDSISTINVSYDDFGNKEELYNFKLKVSKSNTLGICVVKPDQDNINEGSLIDYISEPEFVDSSLLKLHDFGKNLTSLNFNNFENSSCFLDININIPNNCYGLMMIYYTGETDKSNNDKLGAHIYYIKNENTKKLKIFNNIVNKVEDWWSGYLESGESYDKAYLQRGVNIIKIDPSITNLRIYGDTELKNSIIISDLDAVYTETDTISDLNLNLIDYQLNGEWTCANRAGGNVPSDFNFNAEIVLVNNNTKKATYYAEGIPHKIIEGLGLKNNANGLYSFYIRSTDTTPVHKRIREELLRELNKLDVDHQFYYNCLVNNSVALNINPGLVDTEEAEKLSTPRIWYDSNNINNKFVISEIDANWLEHKNGIMIARSSKR